MSKSRDIADSAATINYIDGLTSDAQTQLDGKATLDASPTFTGTVTATAFSGDGSGLTGVDSLPSQTGNSGKFLTTDGSAASWDAVDVSSEITGTLPVANGGTGATTLTANSVLLGNGTSAPLAVAPSTSGNVLTSNGTTWESVAPAGGGAWELISATTLSTSVAQVDIAIPTGYKEYILMLQNVQTVSNGGNMALRTSTDGGSTFSNGNGDYRHSIMQLDSNGNSSNDTSNTTNSIFLNSSGTSTANYDGFNMVMHIHAPGDTTQTTMDWRASFLDALQYLELVLGAGSRLSAADVDYIRLFNTSVNMDKGYFALYGVKRS